MYDENIHTTHIAYGIRQIIDYLIIHIQTIDIKMGFKRMTSFTKNLKPILKIANNDTLAKKDIVAAMPK